MLINDRCLQTLVGARTRYLLYFLLYWCTAVPLQAQFNLVSGYDISLGGTEQLNQVIDVFNQGGAGEDLDHVRLHHAFILGLRYNFEFGAVHATFSRSFNRKRSNDLTFAGEMTDLIFSHGITSWMAGLEFGETFVVGATFNYHQMRYQADFGEITDIVHRDGSIGNRLYLGIQSRGNGNVSIAIKPYVQILWSDINIYPIEEVLTARPSCTQCVEKKPLYFGLTVTIQNGAQ